MESGTRALSTIDALCRTLCQKLRATSGAAREVYYSLASLSVVINETEEESSNAQLNSEQEVSLRSQATSIRNVLERVQEALAKDEHGAFSIVDGAANQLKADVESQVMALDGFQRGLTTFTVDDTANASVATASPKQPDVGPATSPRSIKRRELPASSMHLTKQPLAELSGDSPQTAASPIEYGHSGEIESAYVEHDHRGYIEVVPSAYGPSGMTEPVESAYGQSGLIEPAMHGNGSGGDMKVVPTIYNGPGHIEVVPPDVRNSAGGRSNSSHNAVPTSTKETNVSTMSMPIREFTNNLSPPPGFAELEISFAQPDSAELPGDNDMLPSLEKSVSSKSRKKLNWNPSFSWKRLDKLLSDAVKEGNGEKVRSLLKEGADANSSSSGKSPIERAVKRGNAVIVKLLLEHGAITMLPKHRSTPTLAVLLALQCPTVTEFESVLGGDVDLEATDNRDWTPLALASLQELIRPAQCLISIGSKLETRDARGRTPLHHTVYRRHEQMAKLLLRHGANIEARDDSGLSTLCLAVGADKDAQYSYARSATDFERKIDPDPNFDRVSMVRVLLDHEAELDAVDRAGRTALYYAINANNEEIAIFLRDRGASVTKRFSTDGSTLLHFAVATRRQWAVTWLLKEGCDIAARNSDGTTPLHLAVSTGTGPKQKNEIIRSLIFRPRAGDINSQDDEGWTPLHHAAKTGDKDAITCLHTRYAKEIPNNDGRTPEKIAERFGNQMMYTHGRALAESWREKTGWFEGR